ncbi:hypothetical protein E2C01_079347 [Portunus trituberculatus]|uniref:Uncharacterized protein n=1 Tax=Portunus trituberculatus TaxID=210409 RepID=A0A5B7IWP1_PORTR|nr:hypothetical protein [Portunus trituberculatus]
MVPPQPAASRSHPAAPGSVRAARSPASPPASQPTSHSPAVVSPCTPHWPRYTSMARILKLFCALPSLFHRLNLYYLLTFTSAFLSHLGNFLRQKQQATRGS